jgi:hypothetical protein
MSSIRFLLTVSVVGCLCLAGTARADFYAYGVQQTSGYTFTGATVGTLSPNSLSSAAQTATPAGADAHVGTTDVLESYVGPAAGKPPENTFTPKGLTTPSYARGDALLSFVPGTPVTSNVAELYMVGGGPGTNAAASGSWSLSAPIAVTTIGGSALSLTFAYVNTLSVIHTGLPPGVVQASYSYTFTVQDAAGAIIFTSSPTAVNNTISLLVPGATTLPGSGSLTITTGTLGVGTYTATISGTETVFANAVPEPSTVVLMGLGIAGVAGTVARRRLARTAE